MISLSDVRLDSLTDKINFSFDGSSLCIISQDADSSRAIADLVCGIRKPSSGSVSCGCGIIPLANPKLPLSLTAGEYLDTVCSVLGCPLSSFSHELTREFRKKSIKWLSGIQRSKVALAAVFACEHDAVFAEDLTKGLLKNERDEIMRLLFSEDADATVIYTTDSASELEKSEYTLALANGKMIFYGKTEDFIKEATEIGTMTVRIAGDQEKAAEFFKKYGSDVESDIKKNVYKANLPADTDIDALKKELKSYSLHFLDYKIDSEKISLLYNSLLENDLALTEEYEDYKRETSGPKKLEISDFIFDSDEDDEDDDEEDEKR